MKLYTKMFSMDDIVRVTNERIRHQSVCVKYSDGSFEVFPVMLLTTEESECVLREMYLNGVSRYDYKMVRRRDIPGILGVVNGFLILHESAESFIENGVIDLLKTRIDRQRLRDHLAKTVILNRSVDNEDLGKTD